jgi:polysaccharide export outer membrane protein
MLKTSRLFAAMAIASAILAPLAATAQSAVSTAQSAGGTAQTAAARTAAPRPPVPAVPADYTIGPEDVLGVVFWREQEISGDVVVQPDGMITLPLVGNLRAGGMKIDTLRDQIQEAASKYLNEANVTVLPRQINSRKVFITGEVGTPGTYPLTGPRTVMQLIALAGGLTEFAESEEISIIREGRPQAFKFNYKDVAKGKKLEQNIQLQPGDTVVVP